MIQINKILNRPDGGKVPTGSLVDFSTRFVTTETTVVYNLNHWISQATIDDGKTTIPAVSEFQYRIVRVCTEAEWTALNDDAGAGALVTQWLADIIGGVILV